MDRMSGSEIFSVIDLKSGYHQISMETRDIEKTSFQFERRKYEFVRMPFGLKNAPITFQRMIDDFLLGLDKSFIQAYMDDLIIFSKSAKDPERQLIKFPDFEKQFILTTDASQVAVGAVLSQGEGDSERPIAFASKKLTPAETRYSTIERELLGIVWATKHFRPYLLGRQFKIKTDHKPLVWVKKLDETSARINRWKETLAAYNFEIVHTKGRDNVVADCLSRQVNPIDDVDADYAERFLRGWLGESSEASGTDSEEPWGFEPLPNTVNEPTNRKMTLDKGIINDKHNQLIVVRMEGQGIETMRHTYGQLKTGLIKVGREYTDNELKERIEQMTEMDKTYYIYINNDQIKSKILEWHGKRELMPDTTLILCNKRVETVEDQDRQRTLIINYHYGLTNHRGAIETSAQLKRHNYWTDMLGAIKRVIAECSACNESKYERHPAITPQQVTETPMTHLDQVQADTWYWREGLSKRQESVKRFYFIRSEWRQVMIQDNIGRCVQSTVTSDDCVTYCAPLEYQRCFLS
ncbi:hypothetical protein AAG570_006946 [Ranatra chinensis]|uniref:RNA-directed DNA polymerase n=1 Tax=Ranatra chinensis TaxID=642074 RepID=A0ABD0YXN9_9HEMI